MDDLCYYEASIEHLLLADTHQTSNAKSNSIKLLVIAPTQVVKLQESCLQVSKLSVYAMGSQMLGMQSEWRKRVASSPEAKRAASNLEFHRRKIRKMHDELSVAEEWEKELEKRLKNAEENVKPPILKFAEELDKSYSVEESIIEATIHDEDYDRLMAMMRKKAAAMLDMDRSQLIGLAKTILVVRDRLIEKENQEGVDLMQQMATEILKHLGKVEIDWLHMKSWEAHFMRLLLKQVHINCRLIVCLLTY